MPYTLMYQPAGGLRQDFPCTFIIILWNYLEDSENVRNFAAKIDNIYNKV